MKRTLIPVALACATGLLCGSITAQAQKFERDITLAQKLNEIGLNDYAESHIQKLLAQYPGNELLMMQQAINLLEKRENAQANAILAKIKPESPVYLRTQDEVGQWHMRHRNNAEAAKYLSIVFEAVKNDPSLFTQYQDSINMLLGIYRSLGRNDKMQEISDTVVKLASSANESRRDTYYRKGMLAIGNVEPMMQTQEDRLNQLTLQLNGYANTFLQKTANAFPGNAAKLQEAQKKLQTLLASRKAEDDKFFNALKGNANASNANRLNVYKDLGKLVSMPEADIVELSERVMVRQMQEHRRRIMLISDDKRNDYQRQYLAKYHPYDWQDTVYQAKLDFEEALWGDQDIRMAQIIAQLMRCNYYLKNYDESIALAKRYKPLFDACDDLYSKDKEFGIEDSPGADAKMWEANVSMALGKKFEAQWKQAKNDKDAKSAEKEMLKYYKRAFVNYGKLLKNCPKHRDAGVNYPKFLEVIAKLKTLDPKLTETLDNEMAKVPKPAATSTGELEELVTPLAEQKYKEGLAKADDIRKRLSVKQSVTSAAYASMRNDFNAVIAELLPAMNGKYLSNGMPKLMSYLMIAAGYSGDYLLLQTLADYGAYKYRNNELVSYGIIMGANALWTEAERLAKDDKTAEALSMKNQAITVYNRFIRQNIAHAQAPQAARRLAREEFTRADEIGKAINKEKDEAKKTEMRKDWVAGFDRAVAAFDFIIQNFSSQEELLDEAYETSIEAYRLTERYEDAARMGEAYCNAGSANKIKLIRAKIGIPLNLHSLTRDLEKTAGDVRKKAEAIALNEPALPVKEEIKPLTRDEMRKKLREEAKARAKAEAAAAKAQEQPQGSETSAGTDAAASTPAPESNPLLMAPEELDKLIEQDLKERQANAEKEYENAMNRYKTALEKYNSRKTEKEALLKEADERDSRLLAIYLKAIGHAEEFINKWMAPNGQYAALLKDQTAVQNLYRAHSLLPWLYNGASEKLKLTDKKSSVEYCDKAINAFAFFLKTYPDDKSLPSYMIKLSMLYTAKEDYDNADRILSVLGEKFNNTTEGKLAKTLLVKNQIQRGQYDLALQTLNDIFSKPELQKNLTTSNYRMFASELLKCTDEKYKASAAEYALKFCNILLNSLQDMQLEEWVRPDQVEFYTQDKEAREKLKWQIKCIYTLNAAQAATVMGNHLKAIEYFNELAKDGEQSPFFYEYAFGRAEAYTVLADQAEAEKKAPADIVKYCEQAREDLQQVAIRSTYLKKTADYNKAQTMQAYLWEKEARITQDDKKLDRALAFYYLVASTPFEDSEVIPVEENAGAASEEQAQTAQDNTPAPQEAAEETAAEDPADAYHPEEDEWLEKAVYKAAALSKERGRQSQAEQMIEKYRKYYGKEGKFAKEIEELAK